MAPEALFALANSPTGKVGAPNQTVIVVLHPGTDHEASFPAERPHESGVISVGDRYYKLTYNVFKMDDVHNPAVRLLDPDALSQGDQLRLIYSEWSNGRFQPMKSAMAAVGQKPILPSPPAGAARTGEIAIFAALITRFAQTVPSIPAGAIVVGPDNDVVGVVTAVTDTGTSSFANVGAMDQVTDAVGVDPSTDKQYGEFLNGSNKAAGSADQGVAGRQTTAGEPQRTQTEMVPVLGGPLEVAPVLHA
jgi:hypothetical protein